MRSISYGFIAMIGIAAAQASPNEAPASVYDLSVELTNQAGVAHGFDVYRGHPVLISMFYGSCPMTCPILIDTIREVERGVPNEQRRDLRVLMISIDPEHDTTQALQQLAQERRIDASRWTLARTDQKSVRKIAALLDIQYRALPNGGYNHSSIVTVLSANGENVAQSSQLGKADEALIAAIQRASPRISLASPAATSARSQ